MMKKKKPVQPSAGLYIVKRVAFEVTVISVSVTLLLIICFWLSSVAEEAVTEAEQVKNEINQKSIEIQTLQTKIAQFGNALPLWNNFKNKSGTQSFRLSRDEATSVFMELRDQYAFKDIRVTVSPIRPSSDPNMIRPTIQVMESDININMRAYSDEQVVKFMQDVRQRLQGIVKVKSLKMTRNQSETPAFQGGVEGQRDELFALNEPQLDVVINILWYGIETIETNPPEGMPGLPPGVVP